MTKFPEIFAALTEPFVGRDVKQREGGRGKKLSYITARTVQNRLDDVLGPESWHFELVPWGNDALIGTLIIVLPDGSTVRKSDVGGRAGMQTADDDTKSAASDALKRCAVHFGIGRELYNDGQVDFRQQAPAREEKPKDVPRPAIRLLNWAKREGHLERAENIAQKQFGTSIEGLNDAQARVIYKILTEMNAVANVIQPEARPAPHSPGHNGNGNPKKFGWPTSGAAFFAWMKALGGSFKTDVVGSVKNGFVGQPKNFGDNFLTWTPAQVQEAAVYVASLVSQFPGYTGEFDAKLPKTLQDWREEIWQAASKLVEAMGNSPTTEAIELHLQSVSQSLASQFGGEVLDDLEKCENVAMLTAILAAVQADLKDATATY